MEVDSGGRHILVACQDRGVRVYSTRTGRHTKTFRGSVGDDGSLIKVCIIDFQKVNAFLYVI